MNDDDGDGGDYDNDDDGDDGKKIYTFFAILNVLETVLCS